MRRILAIDIGGTTAKCAVVQSDGTLNPQEGFATGPFLRRSKLERCLLNALSRAGPVDGVGISTLGVVDSARGILLGGVENVPCLLDFCPGDAIGHSHPGLPVRLINDAAAAALGEQWLGAARGCRNFVCVAFGTGVGGCLFLNGQPLKGVHGRAGEIGYWDYAAPGDYWELRGSAQALIDSARKQTGDSTLDGISFFRRVAAEDPVCVPLFTAWAAHAGRIFANIALLLDMERIVVGGGISAQGEALTKPLQTAMDACLPPAFRGGCRVVPAQTGNHAALLGAARLFLTEKR